MDERVIYSATSPGRPPTLLSPGGSTTVTITDRNATFGDASYPLDDVGLVYLRYFEPPRDLGCLIGWFGMLVIERYAGASVWLEYGTLDRCVYRCQSIDEGKTILRALLAAQELRRQQAELQQGDPFDQ